VLTKELCFLRDFKARNGGYIDEGIIQSRYGGRVDVQRYLGTVLRSRKLARYERKKSEDLHVLRASERRERGNLGDGTGFRCSLKHVNEKKHFEKPIRTRKKLQ